MFDGIEADAAVSLSVLFCPLRRSRSRPSQTWIEGRSQSISFNVSYSNEWNINIEAAIDNVLDRVMIEWSVSGVEGNKSTEKDAVKCLAGL
jgi:hypothetical protein